MAATEDELTLLELAPGDAAGCLPLSREAHWNQTEADWRTFLSQGTVYGLRDSTSHLIATAALLPYTSTDAWISMVLVTERWRRRGLATRLVDSCLATAAQRGLTTWLDATPAGAAVYQPLGFAPTIHLQRLRLAQRDQAGATDDISPGDLGAFIARDAEAMGFARRALLAELSGRPGSRLLSTPQAMALVRDGRTARHIGPVFADDPECALALVAGIVANEPGPHLIDAVAERTGFLDGLIGAGWRIERPFSRMRRGEGKVGTGAQGFAVAGPEYG